MIQSMMRVSAAWIFNQPVDPEKLHIPDYLDIITKPMDFGTIRENLKKHEYFKIEEVIKDIMQVFSNCVRYNGVNSQPGALCKEMHGEFKNLYNQLNISFYLTDETYDID